MQYFPVTNKMFGCCWTASLLSFRIDGTNFYSVKCFLSKANRSPILPYLLKNTTTLCFWCVAVQIRKKEHLPPPRETNNFTLTFEQVIKCSYSWNTLNRKLGFINSRVAYAQKYPKSCILVIEASHFGDKLLKWLRNHWDTSCVLTRSAQNGLEGNNWSKYR